MKINFNDLTFLLRLQVVGGLMVKVEANSPNDLHKEQRRAVVKALFRWNPRWGFNFEAEFLSQS